jgi:hypothetical protein
MSKFLILIYDDDAAYEAADEATMGRVMSGHEQFGTRNGEAVAGGNALEAARTAKSVRPDGSGDFLVTDGPFVETKEALGGYYLVEAPDLDAAVEMAKQVPVLAGGLEVRPVMVFD